MDYPYRDFTHAVEELDRVSDIESKRWHIEKRKVGAVWALRSAFVIFWKAYFTENGRKEGAQGLFLSVHKGMLVFLTYAKYWELGRNQNTGA